MARGYVQKKHGMWLGEPCNGHHQNGSTNTKYDPKSFPSHEERIKLKQPAWSCILDEISTNGFLSSIHKNTTPTYNPWDWYICLHERLIFMVNVGT